MHTLVAILLLVGTLNTHAAIDQRQAKIFRLMELTHVSEEITPEKFRKQTMQFMPKQAKESREMRQAFERSIGQLIAKIDIEAIKEEVALLYETHYTEEDIDALIAFYSTPAGQKVLSKNSIIIEEARKVGIRAVEKAAVALKEDAEKKEAK